MWQDHGNVGAEQSGPSSAEGGYSQPGQFLPGPDSRPEGQGAEGPI